MSAVAAVEPKDRRVLAAGLASLGGAAVGAVTGGVAGGLAWEAVTGPHEGLEGLGALVAGVLVGVVTSYPGALLGAWLVLRGRPMARRTVGLLALLYPAAAVLLFVSVLGLGQQHFYVPLQSVAILGGVGVGSAARALALHSGGGDG
jgi:hypothetical protein